MSSACWLLLTLLLSCAVDGGVVPSGATAGGGNGEGGDDGSSVKLAPGRLSLNSSSSNSSGPNSSGSSGPLVAVCITGAVRNFLEHFTNIRDTLAATNVSTEYFFVLSNDSVSSTNSKGHVYPPADALEVTGAARSFQRLSYLTLNGEAGAHFVRNKECRVADSTQSHPIDRLSTQHNLARFMETFAKLEACYVQVVLREQALKRQFTMVLRLRPDMFFFDALSPEVLTSSNPIFPNGGIGARLPAFNDHLAFLPRRHAKPFFTAGRVYKHCTRAHVMTMPVFGAQKLPIYLRDGRSKEVGVEWKLAPPRTMLIPYAIAHGNATGQENCERVKVLWNTANGKVDGGTEGVGVISPKSPIAQARYRKCVEYVRTEEPQSQAPPPPQPPPQPQPPPPPPPPPPY